MTKDMNDKIQQKDINNAAWAACDTFRGAVDPAQYKDYILVMLFVKYISDVWNDHYAEYKKQYGDDDVRIRRKLERERFVLPMVELTEEVEDPATKEKKTVVTDTFLANYYSLLERKNEPNIGELINIVLEHIETANKAKLEGVFRNIDFNSEANLGKTKDRNRRLKTLLDDFNKPALDMSPSRVLKMSLVTLTSTLLSALAPMQVKKQVNSTPLIKSLSWLRVCLHQNRGLVFVTLPVAQPGY